MIQGLAFIIVSFFILILLYIGFPDKKRDLVEYSVEIKDLPQEKTMKEFKNDVENLLKDMRFSKINDHDYEPPFMIPLNEPILMMEDCTYYINFKSSKLLKRLILSLLEQNF